MRRDTLTPTRLACAAAIACAAALIPAASLAATAAPGTASAAASATMARQASAPACATSGLVVWAYPNYGGGYAGGYRYTVSFTNLSGHPCTLRGYPGVTAVSLTGRQLGSPAGWNKAKLSTVTLARGATATAQLDIGDAGAYCQPVTAAGLRVYPPNQRVAKVVPIPFGACPHAGPVWMHLEPVRGQGGSASKTAQR
jgi:hypothetical protein